LKPGKVLYNSVPNIKLRRTNADKRNKRDYLRENEMTDETWGDLTRNDGE
jgi:hypothetical protein